jgi:fumarylacetoacetase
MGQFTRPAADGITSTISRTNSKHLVWSFEQMIAHHTLGGCPLAAGDLLGSGTISGPGGPSEAGCLLEMTRDGKQPIEVKGEDGRAVQRKYLEDGDTVAIRGWAGPDGGRIGFGELVAKIEPAKWPL